MQKSKQLFAVLILLGAFGLVGCGLEKVKDEVINTVVAGSCTVVASGVLTYCIDYSGSGWTRPNAEPQCTAQASGGVTATFSTSGCTMAGRVGSCVVQSGMATQLTFRFLSGYDNASATAACSTWSGVYTSG